MHTASPTLRMTNYKFSDVVLVLFLQPDGERKQRPALAILDTGDDDIVLAPITSKERRGREDCRIKNWKQASLLSVSWVRLAKVACISKEDIVRKLGRLTSSDVKNVVSVWSRLYKLK